MPIQRVWEQRFPAVALDQYDNSKADCMVSELPETLTHLFPWPIWVS